MKTITDHRYKARAIGEQIHNWRKENIAGYKDNTTNWSGETLSDEEYDSQYKHQFNDLWHVELDDENVFNYPVMELPNDWFKPIDYEST